MRALVKTERGRGHLDLRNDWPSPTARPGWVVINVIACGICGTDLHILEDEHKNWPPVVLGHEYVGRISELGDGVFGWSLGDRVVCEQHTLACGVCDACRRGAIHLCPHKRSPGWGIDGGFADRLALPANLLHRVPDEVTDLGAVVTEPTAICITGLDRAALATGERVVVVGPGPIGLICALLARASGAAEVTVIGRSSSRARLAIARDLGFCVLVGDEAEAGPAILDVARGLGVDLALETSASASGLELAVAATRRLGRVVCLGISGRGSIPFPVDAAMERSVTVHFSMSSEYSAWARALQLMASGRYDPSPLVTTYALEMWSRAFDDVAKHRVVKAALTPGSTV